MIAELATDNSNLASSNQSQREHSFNIREIDVLAVFQCKIIVFIWLKKFPYSSYNLYRIWWKGIYNGWHCNLRVWREARRLKLPPPGSSISILGGVPTNQLISKQTAETTAAISKTGLEKQILSKRGLCIIILQYRTLKVVASLKHRTVNAAIWYM